MSNNSRLERMVAAMDAANVDAVLLCTPESMGYAHGFFEDAHERMLLLALRANGDVAMIAPALSAEQASRAGIQDIRTWRDGEPPLALFEGLAVEWELRTAVVAVDSAMRADHLLQIQAAVPSAMFHPADPLFGPVMARKDAQELEWLTKAGAVVDDVYEELVSKIKPGLTEVQIEAMIRQMVLERGAKPTFCIVGVGPGSAEPHHLNGDATVELGQLLLMDFGCELGRYQADITRVVHVGPATDKVRFVYRAVRSAVLAGQAAVRPGVTGAEVDQAARERIVEAGFGEFFTHRTGHGIGLRGHELPNIASDNLTPLEVGNTFSIEPGIYLPGEFGIRLENIYACGESGAIAINKKEFEEEILEL